MTAQSKARLVLLSLMLSLAVVGYLASRRFWFSADFSRMTPSGGGGVEERSDLAFMVLLGPLVFVRGGLKVINAYYCFIACALMVPALFCLRRPTAIRSLIAMALVAVWMFIGFAASMLRVT